MTAIHTNEIQYSFVDMSMGYLVKSLWDISLCYYTLRYLRGLLKGNSDIWVYGISIFGCTSGASTGQWTRACQPVTTQVRTELFIIQIQDLYLFRYSSLTDQII